MSSEWLHAASLISGMCGCPHTFGHEVNASADTDQLKLRRSPHAED